MPPNAHNTVDMTNELFDYCIQELQHRAKGINKDPSAPIVVYNGDVLKVDSLALKIALQDAVKPLETVLDWQKDRGSGHLGTVLNLVDPSLYPLVYGTTRALKVGAKVVGVKDCIERCGEGETIAKTKPSLDENDDYMAPISLLFQWLPSDVNIDGDRARYVSHCREISIRLSLRTG